MKILIPLSLLTLFLLALKKRLLIPRGLEIKVNQELFNSYANLIPLFLISLLLNHLAHTHTSFSATALLSLCTTIVILFYFRITGLR